MINIEMKNQSMPSLQDEKLDKDMAKTDKVIADFCKELGIKTPF